MINILPQLLTNALIAGGIYALVSCGLSLGYGLLRILNFAHGHVMMLAVYVFYHFLVERSMGLITAGILTAIFTALFAIVIFRIFVLPFSKYHFLLVLITTLALSNMLEALVSMIFGVNVKSLPMGSFSESIEIGNVYITPIQLIIIFSAVALLSFIAFIIHSTSIGRKIRALSQNEYAAQAIGISKLKTSYLVFIAATLLAAYSGILVGYETNFQPTMGASYTIKGFAAMILGGLGNLWGSILGSYFLGLIENLGIGLDFGGYSIPAGYKDAFVFMVILLVLLVRPQGLFGSKARNN